MRQVREHPLSFLSLDTGGECRGDRGKVAAEDLCCSLYSHLHRSPVLNCCPATSNCDEKGDDTFNYSSNSKAGQVLDHTADIARFTPLTTNRAYITTCHLLKHTTGL